MNSIPGFQCGTLLRQSLTLKASGWWEVHMQGGKNPDTFIFLIPPCGGLWEGQLLKLMTPSKGNIKKLTYILDEMLGYLLII